MCSPWRQRLGAGGGALALALSAGAAGPSADDPGSPDAAEQCFTGLAVEGWVQEGAVTQDLGSGSVAFPVTASGLIEDTHYVVSRHMSLNPGVVAGFNTEDGTSMFQEEIVLDGENSEGGWGAAVFEDQLYIGMSFEGERRSAIMRLDHETGELTEAGSTFPARLIWDMDAAPDGIIYASTSRQNNAGLWEYDPETDETQLIDHLQGEERQDARSVAAVDDSVYIGLGNAAPDLIAYDRDSGESDSILPEEMEEASYVYALEATEDVIAAGTRSPAALAVIDPEDPEDYEVLPVSTGTVQAIEIVDETVYFVSGTHLWSYDADEEELHQLAELKLPGGQTRGLFHQEGTLHGSGNLGHLWSYDLDDDEAQVVDPAEGDNGEIRSGEPAQSLAVTEDAVYTGGHFTLGIRDRQSGELGQDYVPGEAKDAVVVDGSLYLAMYSSGDLVRYEPETQEYQTVARSPSGHNRPRALDYDAEEQLLVMSVQADSAGGGSVTVYDPATGESVSHEPFDDRASSAVATEDGVAYVAGSTGMQDGDAGAQITALESGTGEVIWEVEPLEDSAEITGLVLQEELLYGITSGGTLFVLDTESQEVLDTQSGFGPGDLLEHQGDIYGATEEQLFAVELAEEAESLQTQVVLDDLEAEWFTWPSLESDGCSLYVLEGSQVVQVSGEAAPGDLSGPPDPSGAEDHAAPDGSFQEGKQAMLRVLWTGGGVSLALGALVLLLWLRGRRRIRRQGRGDSARSSGPRTSRKRP